jgi:hypothetical protein
MSGKQLFDVPGVFAPLLQSAEEQQQNAVQKQLGLFGAGLSGSLANSIANLEVGGRASLNKLLKSVDPSMDIRTNQQRLTESINSINPEDPDAESKYLEAVQQFAPERMGEIQDRMRTRRLEDAAEQRRVNEEQRSQDTAGRLAEAHEADMRTRALSESVANLDFNDAVAAREGIQAQREYILSTKYGAGMEQELAAMTPEQIKQRFDKVVEVEGSKADGFRRAVRAVLPEGPVLEHLDLLGQQQLEGILAGVVNKEITPDTRVVQGINGEQSLLITDPFNPGESELVPLLAGRPPKVEEPDPVRALPEDIKDLVTSATGVLDRGFFQGGDSVMMPEGSRVSSSEMLERAAGNYYQRNKDLTEGDFRGRVEAAVAAITAKGNYSYEDVQAAIADNFPRTSADNLIDRSRTQ